MPGIGIGLGIGLKRTGDPYGSELYNYANALADPAGTEADSTSGITAGGLSGGNTFASQSAVKNAGVYSIHAESNDTPTGSARVYFDLTAVKFNFVNDEEGKIEFDARHVGVGGIWSAYFASSTFGVNNLIDSVENTDITFLRYKYEFTYDANHRYFNFRERGLLHDGGIYLDNISVKKKL
jgi:hypothetical protein